MTSKVPLATALLLHGGELDDVRDLLCSLGVPFVESERVPTPENGEKWALLVTTPQRILELQLAKERSDRCVYVAIGDSESRTLRTAMSRLNIDFFVRRPVHPEALRLLLLHTIYRGPEKRRAKRVNIGLPVRIRAGMRRRRVILVDLSETGCRLLAAKGLGRGRKLSIALPAGGNSKTTLSLRGTVLRTSLPEIRTTRGWLIHVLFDPMLERARVGLARIVHDFESGPASARFEQGGARRLVQAAPPDPKPQTRDEDLADDPLDGDTEPLPAPEEVGEVTSPERRSQPRRVFPRRVVALDGAATRVLVGRDLSPGGMRTDPDPTLHVGDTLTVALPLRARAPLVVSAKVIRNDAEGGQVLEFQDLTEESAKLIEHTASLLPICDVAYEDEEPAWVIVSEVLDQVS